MGRKMDWVPMQEWGTQLTVGPNLQLDHPLMDPAIYSDTDVEGRFDDSPGRYFVNRIVGTCSVVWAATPTAGGLIHECIWPGIIDDPNLGLVISPGFIDDAAGQNPRLWWRRTKQSSSSSDFVDLNSLQNKWFSQIDITPRQVIDDGQIPLYSIINTDGQIALRVTLWLRLLLTKLE